MTLCPFRPGAPVPAPTPATKREGNWRTGDYKCPRCGATFDRELRNREDPETGELYQTSLCPTCDPRGLVSCYDATIPQVEREFGMVYPTWEHMIGERARAARDRHTMLMQEERWRRDRVIQATGRQLPLDREREERRHRDARKRGERRVKPVQRRPRKDVFIQPPGTRQKRRDQAA